MKRKSGRIYEIQGLSELLMRLEWGHGSSEHILVVHFAEDVGGGTDWEEGPPTSQILQEVIIDWLLISFTSRGV